MPADPLPKDHVPFHIDVHPERETVRVVPVGELDLVTAPELEAQLHDLRRSGFVRVVLDLRELRFVDSSGIRVIVTEHRYAGANDREFSFIGGSPTVQRALEVCGVLGQPRDETGSA